jgi:phosphatidylserine/phosphatidylglycerophosphate/cardiolipin synthase-like enzyme
MPLRHEVPPFSTPLVTHGMSGLRLVAASGITLVLALALLPGLARPSVAAAPPPAADVPATAPSSTLTSATRACARKKRQVVRRACRAAVRRELLARAAQVRRARAAAVSDARTARARAATAVAAANRARALAATTSHKQCKAKKSLRVRQKCHRTVRKQNRVKRRSAARARAAERSAERAHQLAMAAVGRPPRAYSPASGSYFSYPNRSASMKRAIRSRLLAAIRSTWGGPRDGSVAWAGNGTIRITTWSFNDWQIARALVGAHRRGVSVQVIAARRANREHRAWRWLRHRLGTRLAHPSVVQSADRVSFARQCRGSCRGGGGTPHAKYMLIDRVGPSQARHVVIQTSMNLTRMAYQGQWNQAQIMHSAAVYDDYMRVFRQARLGGRVTTPYHTAALGQVVNYFFPRPRATADEDPVMQALSGVRCLGAKARETRRGRTKIRIVQYAMHGTRGIWIAKRLRKLQNAGCDIAIIYSVTSRPVREILLSRRGRGPIPMRQSVLIDRWGWVSGYNHGKWMTITGAWGSSKSDHLTFSGSANWSNEAFGNDEQMQLIRSVATARSHNKSFARTWRQRSSRPPGRVVGWSVRGE